MKRIKTILMGTAGFAAEIFEKTYPVLRDKFEIVAVITASNKPVGRKQELLPSPVKKFAEENKLKVLQPQKIRDSEWIEKIRELNPDLIILCAYAQIIPKEILDIPKYNALNIHPSLLPKYRGASPIHAAILNGDTETGVTIILMDEQLDHGPIIQNSKFKIQNSRITYKELENQLIDVAADLLIKTLLNWVEGKIKPKPQDHSKATFCKIIKKQHGKIDWNKSAEEIERMVRAYYIWPSAYTFFNNKQLKILKSNPVKSPAAINGARLKKIGEVFTINKDLAIQTGQGVLIVERLQLEGKKPMPARDFFHGHPEIISSVLK